MKKLFIKRFLIALNFAVLLGLAFWGGRYSYTLGKDYLGKTTQAQQQSAAVYSYLTENIAKTKDGKVITRAAALDAVLKQVLEQAQKAEQGPAEKK